MSSRLRGVVVPVCTPLDIEATSVDERSLRRHLNHLHDAGVDGVFILGTSGEFGFLTDGQRREVVRITVDEVGDRLPVLVGISDTASARAVQQAAMLITSGVDAAVATAPFFAAAGPMEIAEHFRAVHRAIGDVPLIAYENPERVNGHSIPPDVAIELAEEGVIQGVKDSSGDHDYLRSLLAQRERRGLLSLSILSGSEVAAADAMLAGADGLVPGLGNVDPAGYVRLVQLAAAGDTRALEEEQERLKRLFSIVSIETQEPIGGSSRALGAFKAAMKLLGVIDHDPCAPPAIRLQSEDRARIQRILGVHGPRVEA